MSRVGSICDAIVTALDGGTFSQSFTPIKSYAPILTHSEMSDVRVIVFPLNFDTERESRGVRQHDHVIHIGVIKKLANKDEATVDPWITLVEEIDTFINAEANRSLAGGIGKIVESKTAPIFDADMLNKQNLFASIIAATYRELAA